MKKYSIYTTISGREIKVRSNKKARTFTIKTESGKYRTCPMNKSDFQSCMHNTGNDWQHFLRGSDYSPV